MLKSRKCRAAIGILGGMGPQASCELYRLINTISVEKYSAERNSDFPYLLIASIPVPDLISDSDHRDETVGLVGDSAQQLCMAGADDMVMACNTMHAFIDDITSSLKCRFHSIVDIVMDSIIERGIDSVFILATKTTLESSLYQKALNRRGINYRLPSEQLQEITVQNILKCIAGHFSPEDRENYMSQVSEEARGDTRTKAILLACTELPLILPDIMPDFIKISSLEEMAKKVCTLHFQKKQGANGDA